jgi:hypothetical protein
VPVLAALCRTFLQLPPPLRRGLVPFISISRGRSCALRIVEAPITQHCSHFHFLFAANGAGHGYSGILETLFTCYVSKGATSRRSCSNLNLNQPTPQFRSDHIESREAGLPNHRAALQTEGKRLLLHPDWLPYPIEPYHAYQRFREPAGWLFDTSPSCHPHLSGRPRLHCKYLLPSASAARCWPVV